MLLGLPEEGVLVGALWIAGKAEQQGRRSIAGGGCASSEQNSPERGNSRRRIVGNLPAREGRERHIARIGRSSTALPNFQPKPRHPLQDATLNRLYLNHSKTSAAPDFSRSQNPSTKQNRRSKLLFPATERFVFSWQADEHGFQLRAAIYGLEQAVPATLNLWRTARWRGQTTTTEEAWFPVADMSRLFSGESKAT
ncbi:histidine decarboxylase [Striga asiatica]|uniref:Histidine decarboxylase n=1 Tax=Striga asiatica TaxID=4170 RepID=A0A5A7Q351_STRAF|nr:histidine decarboxylase [Striga asiatica]